MTPKELLKCDLKDINIFGSGSVFRNKELKYFSQYFETDCLICYYKSPNYNSPNSFYIDFLIKTKNGFQGYSFCLKDLGGLLSRCPLKSKPIKRGNKFLGFIDFMMEEKQENNLIIVDKILWNKFENLLVLDRLQKEEWIK